MSAGGKSKASQVLLGDPAPEPVRTYKDRVFDAAVELAIGSDKFRRALLKKLNGLSETKQGGNEPISKHDTQSVRFVVCLIINHHKQIRDEGWKKKSHVTAAIKRAAEILGITPGQAKSRYYASEKFPD
jgi:hypothetical protein